MIVIGQISSAAARKRCMMLAWHASSHTCRESSSCTRLLCDVNMVLVCENSYHILNAAGIWKCLSEGRQRRGKVWANHFCIAFHVAQPYGASVISSKKLILF